MRASSMVTRVPFWPGIQRYPFRASSSSPPGFRAAVMGCGEADRSLLRTPRAPTGLVRSVDEHLPARCVEDAGVALYIATRVTASRYNHNMQEAKWRHGRMAGGTGQWAFVVACRMHARAGGVESALADAGAGNAGCPVLSKRWCVRS